jgi:hypothetical protein
MLATNKRSYPSFLRSNKLRAYRHVLLSALLLLALCAAAAVPALAQVSGQNVNMVSGTNWTNGDPFLQRQNEPSIAVSSRNSSHLLAGANDYRTVDLPGLLGIDERGDAWLGLFKSFDGGRTWQSTLLPGFPLDGSLQGQASPIHGFQAASDPTVRAGTNGLFYYSGIAFNRGSNAPSTVFVSRFIDLNNKENGDAGFESGSMTNLQPRDTIRYVDTTIVDHATPETFLDKPWVAVDIPRQGATCTFFVNEDGQTVTQTIPAGQVYVTYTKFIGSGPSQVSTIIFKKSHDCGATWSSPRILSQNDESSGDAEHQGTVIAIDPSVPPSQPATVYVAWRRFASVNDPGDPPAIFLAKSVDGGVQWGTPFPVVVFPKSCIPTIQNPNPTGVGCPFDQVFTNASFRSNGYPALTVDSTGRVYVAWSQRDANGDGKIMMGISPRGGSIQSGSVAQVDIGPVADDNGNMFSNLSGRGSQLMPSLSFEAGKLLLAYYDLRQDHTTGTFVEAPNPNCDPVVTLPCALGAQYLESRTLEGEISPPNPSNSPSVFGPYVADSAPPLTARRHTIDVMGAEAVPPPSSSLQPPSFKAFRITNYLFGSIPQLFQDVEQIQFNAPNLPLFVDGTAPFMGDYIDVSGTPQIIPDGKGGWTFNTNPSANPVFHASWTDNRDVVPPADGNWRNYTPPISASNPGSQPSKFDPNQQPLACVVGQTGMRNQNVYTAEISQGVILTSPQTSKPVLTPSGQPIQRAFVVEVRNATNAARSFQVSIPSQPATATASFQQFGSLTTQTVKVNAFSSQSLPVFVVANAGSTFAFPSVLVTATENDGANPPLTGSVLLNPDPTNPALTGPDNAAIGANQIAVNEFYNPGVANPGVANSGVASPGVANPGVANPGVANPGVANPTVVLALNPGVANPGVANPGVANPGVANPGVANESVTDASYTFTNEGNTSAAYTIQFFQSAPFPAGAKFQIILSKVYFTEQAVGCQIQQVGSNVIVANVTNPVFVTDPTQLGNPGVANLGVQTPTINLAPGESGQVTIRTNLSVAQVESQVLPNVSPVAVSRAVNTVDVQNGVFTPPINLIITSMSSSLPLGVVNQPYSTSLTSIGGNTGPRNWTILSGLLPPGLQLNAASGAITGTPTQSGSFAFTAQVMDTGAPQHTATRALTITANAPPLVFTSLTVPTAVVGRPYIQTLPVAGGTQPYNASVTSGTLPPGLVLVGNVLTGTPSGTGNFTFTVTVTDSSTPTQTATQTLTIAVNTLVITTTVLPSGIVGVPYNATISTAGGTPPLSFSLATAAFPPGLSIQQGALAGTPTQAGNFFFSETVVDSSTPAQTATRNYEVTIAPSGTPAPANVTFVSQPQNSVGGQTLRGGPVVVRVTDATNTPIPGTTVALTLTGNFNPAPPCSVATLSGTLTAVTDATGQATFSNLSVDRGGFNYGLLAGTGSASQSSGPFSVQGFCASGNLSTQREGHTQDVLGTSNTRKFPLDPKGAYLFTDPQDTSNTPLIIPLASFGIKPGDVISGVPVGDVNFCGFAGEFCFGEIYLSSTCAVFSSSNALLPPSSGVNRVPGAIAPDFTTAFPCNTGRTGPGNFPTDISQDFSLFGERVTVPPGAAYLFVALADTFYADNVDPNGDLGVAFTLNSTNSVNGKVLIAGGADNNGNALNTAELFDPVLGFTQPTGNLTDPNGRANHVSVVLPNGKVLLIGGISNVNFVATAELYDPATGTFTPTGSMSEPRGLPAVVLLADGRVLVSGGFNSPVASNTAEIYDPATGVFTLTGNMTQRRARHQMTLLPNGKVLVTGGRDTQQNFFALANAEIFDPFANQGVGAFTAIGNMNSPRFKHTATLLSNGTVLIAGGFNGGDTSPSVASAEIFDPKTNVFTLTGSMNTPRARHTSTLLPDGTVLEAGGINGFNGVIAAAPAELYSPTSGTFSLTGPMITGREFPTATLLPPNGTVLLSGGDDGVNVLASTEVYYNPVAQTPVVITTTSVPNGVISQPYVQLLLEQNRSGPITWSLASGTLPPGITLSANGILSGTPTAVGSFTFTVQVTDGISTTTASFTVNVSLAALVFTSNTMPAAGAGRPYSQPLPVTGGTQPYSVTVTSGTLPPGLALSSTGILSGTPSGVGSFTFTATVTDSSTTKQTATQTLTIAVDTLFITTTALPSGIVGVPYNATITTAGGTLPLSFSAGTAAFPPGLTIQQPPVNSQSGALVGTPALAGHYTFSESVVDSSNPAQTATQYYVMDIAAAGTTAVPVTLTFTRQPQNSIGGQILGGSPVRVFVTDANNAPIVGASVAISFNGAPPCSTAVLSGTLNGITNGAGNAFFPDLSIDRGQFGYTLLASAGSASAVSQPFTVNGFCNTGSMATARALLNSVTLQNGKVLIAGGAPAFSNQAVAFSSAELYDPVAHSFTTVGSMHFGRDGMSMVVLQNGLVLAAGGFDGSTNLSSAELFDPATNTFSLLPSSMVTGRSGGIATVLANGKVLITGGLGNSGVLASAEIFDPATNMFTATSQPMSAPRWLHEAILLPNGKVLITGGASTFVNGPRNPLASAELYDPVTDTFTATGSMATPRYEHASALLFTGKVLAFGGFTANNFTAPLATAELYDPSTGTFSPTATAPQAAAGYLVPVPVLTDGTVGLYGVALYDPATATYQVTGSTTIPQFQPATSRLADGTGLVTGGVGFPTFDAGLANAEIYYSTAPLAPLQITTPSLLPGAPLGQPYTQMLLERGGVGALTWTLTGGALPTGITLSTNGILQGTPTSTGTFTFTAQLVDSSAPGKIASATFSLTVSGPTLVFGAQSLPTALIGFGYTPPLVVSGGTAPFSFAITGGAPPSGITLGSNGIFSGSATTVGSSTFTVTVTDSSVPQQSASQALTIQVANPLVINTASLPDAVIGAAYSQSLAASGGLGTYTWSLVSGSLPVGTTLSSAGLISGTLTTTGSYSFVLTVTDLSGQSASAPFTVIVANPAPAGSHILFIIQPPGPMGGGSTGLQAVAQLFDANNAPVPGVELTGSFGNKACPDAALFGTVTAVTDSSGLAAFSGISSNRGGNGYTAVASATSNPAVFATSIPFSIQGFCPTGTLTTLRRENTVTLLPNGKVLILGGLNSNTVSAALALNTAELYDPATGVFTATGNMTTARDLATATVLPNGKVLVVGGYNATSATLTSAELYDPATGVFTATGSMSVPRQEHTATVLPNGKVLIAGGVKWAFPTTFYASAEIYDPATGLFTLTETMNSPHVDHTATLLSNGKVLVASGEGFANPDGSNQLITSSAELYDPSAGTFTPTGSLTIGRFNQAATRLSDGRVLITGGYADVNTRAATASAEIYDPATGAFTPTGSMTVARAEHASTSLPDGRVLIAGGFSSLGFFGGTQLSTAEIYNPLGGNFKGPASMAFAHSRIAAPLLPNGAVLLASGTTAELYFPTDPPFLVQEFTATGNLNTPRYDHTATPLSNGLVLIAGGFGSSGVPLASAELYDPATGAFTTTGSLNTTRQYHTATLLSNGLVLIAGGQDSSGRTSAGAELYNPATGTSTATGSLNTARFLHTATLLGNGLVLIAGGANAGASAELYNPATGTFTATGSLTTARYYHTATLLTNGLVLISGGLGPSNNLLASAELYNPATGTSTATGSLNTARLWHAATMLHNGLVLIAGGSGSPSTTLLPLASAELYDPATGTFTATGSLNTARIHPSATALNNGLVLIAGGAGSSVLPLAAELYDRATGTFTATGSLITARERHTATLLPTGKVLVSGGFGNTGLQATSELYQFGPNQQLQPQSCSYEGHIKSVAALSTPAAIQFVNNSASLSFQVFWLDYNGNRVLYATLSPGQSLIQQTFLTHPWVIADTSPAATCQEIYLPLQEQAPAIFPPAQTAHFLVDTGPGSTTLSTAPVLVAGQFLAGQFVLTTAATLDSVQAWMYVSTAGSLNVKISTDNSGLPGTAVFSKSYSMGVQPVGWALFSNYTVALAAGKYWLSFEPTTFVGNMPVGAPNPLPNYAFINVGPWLNFVPPGLGIRISGTSP